MNILALETEKENSRVKISRCFREWSDAISRGVRAFGKLIVRGIVWVIFGWWNKPLKPKVPESVDLPTREAWLENLAENCAAFKARS